jgi:hypothetical protein
MKKYMFLWMILGCVTALIQCAKDTPAISASSGNHPVISGVLFGVGNAFAQNVTVQIRPKSTLADTRSTLPKLISQSLSTTTDGSGSFSFDANLEPGIYVIEAKSGESAALIDSVKIVNKDSNVVLTAATLKPVGAIKGVVRLPNGGDPQCAYVLAFGIDRFASVAADGGFLFGGLAQGAYQLRLVSGTPDYGTLDTDGIEVRSAETTDVQRLSPPYRSVPIPLSLQACYDTMTQTVTLRWNGLDGVVVKGYIVYRREIHKSFAFAEVLDSMLIGDTMFVDTMGVQDQTYEYRLAAINKNNEESIKSDGVKVTFASYFTVDTVFTITYGADSISILMDFALSPSGDIYIPSAQDQLIRIFDPMMNPKGRMGHNVWQYQFIDIADDRVFAVQLDPASLLQNVLVFDGALKDTLITARHVMDINVKKDMLAAAFYPDSLGSGGTITLTATDGVFKKSWLYDLGFICRKLLIADSNKLVCALSSRTSSLQKVVIYDFQGNKLSEKSLSAEILGIEGIAYDARRQRLFLACVLKKQYQDGGRLQTQVGKVCAYDDNLTVVACFNVVNCQAITSINANENGSIFIGVLGLSGPGPVSPGIIKLKPLQR